MDDWIYSPMANYWMGKEKENLPAEVLAVRQEEITWNAGTLAGIGG
jgi:hypothetical protein